MSNDRKDSTGRPLNFLPDCCVASLAELAQEMSSSLVPTIELVTLCEGSYSQSIPPEVQELLGALRYHALLSLQFVDDLLLVKRRMQSVRMYRSSSFQTRGNHNGAELAKALEGVCAILRLPDAIQVEDRENMPRIPVREIELKRLLLNLVSDGLEYTGSAALRMRISCSIVDDGIELIFRDNRAVPVVPRPSVVPRTRGWGLRMEVAYRLVRSWGGELSIGGLQHSDCAGRSGNQCEFMVTVRIPREYSK